MILTVGQVLPAIALNAGGPGTDHTVEPGRTRCIDLYNRASELLALDGDWEGTELEMSLEVQASHVILPYEVENIIWAKLESQAPLDLRGVGYDYIEAGPGFADKDTGPFCALQHVGTAPTHRELTCPMHIMTYSDRPEEGAVLTVQGSDAEGIPARTVLGPGYRVPIVQGTRATNIPGYTGGDEFSDGKLATVRSLTKPVTKGRVYVFGFLPETKRTIWLTTMAPDTTSNTLTKFRVAGVPTEGDATVRARVSLRAAPRYHEDDVALIQSAEAYGRMAKALAYFDEGDINKYAQYKASAISVLGKQLRKRDRNHKHALNVRLARSPGRIRSGTSR